MEVSASGPVGGVELALGHAVVPRLALGLEVGFSVRQANQAGALGESQLFMAFGIRIAAIADYYFEPGGSWHVLAGAGVTRIVFACSTDDIGSPRNIVECEPLSGLVGLLGGGYGWASGFGLDARFSLEHATESHGEDQARYTAFGGTVGASYTWF